jgi:hypothetical protein
MGSQELGGETDVASSGGQFEELVDELNLAPNINSAHPPNLPLPQHLRQKILAGGGLCGDGQLNNGDALRPERRLSGYKPSNAAPDAFRRASRSPPETGLSR